MDILLPTFNHSKIAGSPLGVKHTEKSRRNMSIAQKDIPLKERGHVENCKCASVTIKLERNIVNIYNVKQGVVAVAVVNHLSV